jgi:hypothetical protein
MTRFALSPILSLLSCVACCGQDSSELPDRDSDTGPIKLMQQRASALKVTGASEKLAFAAEPILRYSDPPRGIVDASVWRLGKDGRPRAVLVLEIYNGRSIQYEFTAVADPPKAVKVTTWQWNPAQTDYAWVTIPVESVPEEKRLRDRQIKQLARDFTASEEYRGQTYQLRLMPRPLYQYTDSENGVLEGAVFAWAHGTNVEILMFVESRRKKEDAPPYWSAGFSRLGSASLTVKFQDRDFWSSPTRDRPTQRDSYYYRMETLQPQERKLVAPQ